MIKAPLYPKTCWFENINVIEYPSINEDIETEVAIIGGGITGITCLYLLNKAGISTCLFEGNKLLSGTTGHTTAKVTFQHNLFFYDFYTSIGEEKTKLYASSNLNALNFIKNTINEKNISCDIKDETSYVYTCSDKFIKKIENEVSTAIQFDFPALYFDTLSIPISTKAAVGFKNQFQFNPVKYISGIINFLTGTNKNIYENSKAIDIIENKNNTKKLTVIFDNGKKVSCNYAIVATHFPFVDSKALFFTRLYAEGSYVVAGKTTTTFPGGMYINVERPRKSIRSVDINGEELLLLSGENHAAGHENNTLIHYNNLNAFGNNLFNISDFRYSWYTQDLISVDRIPYIGRLNDKHKNILVATGFGKWGMTNSTTAALLITDIIMNRQNSYEELFNPSRFAGNSSIKNFITQNIAVVKELVKGKVDSPSGIDSLPINSGTIAEINNQKLGIYKDELGIVHIVAVTCSHIGCELKWNDAEKSWDCPCHGSRYSIDGEILEGPATKPLQKYDASSFKNISF